MQPAALDSTDTLRTTVLIVDDEPGPLIALKAMLQKQYAVLTADSGAKALEEFDKHRPAVVVTDVRMPGMDGIQLSRELRKRDADVAIILFTGHGDVHIAREGMVAGVNDFIQKPGSLESIRASVARNAEEARSRIARSKEIRKQAQLAHISTATNEIIHDLNNPLTMLSAGMGMLEAKLRRGPLSPDMEKLIELLKTGVTRCSNLTQYWQQLSREIRLIVQPFDGLALLQEAVEQARIAYPNATIEVSGGNITIQGDRFQMLRVISNLLNNALHEVGDKGKVELELEEQPSSISIHVQDNGRGIPEEIRTSLFKPYVSTKGEKGNGLGLYLSRNIVEAHQGTLTYQSETGKGTTFTVTIPRK